MILDLLVSGLLFVTIVYCWRLSRKISALNASRKELHALIGDFNKTISRAESSISSLKILSGEADQQLQKHIEKARFLANDLAFLTHKGEGLADRLESDVLLRKPSPTRDIRVMPNSNIPLTHNITHPTQSPTLNKKAAGSINPASATKKFPAESAASEATSNIKSSESKKKALEEVLEQIATRKKQLDNQDGEKAGAERQSAQTGQN